MRCQLPPCGQVTQKSPGKGAFSGLTLRSAWTGREPMRTPRSAQPRHVCSAFAVRTGRRAHILRSAWFMLVGVLIQAFRRVWAPNAGRRLPS